MCWEALLESFTTLLHVVLLTFFFVTVRYLLLPVLQQNWTKVNKNLKLHCTSVVGCPRHPEASTFGSQLLQEHMESRCLRRSKWITRSGKTCCASSSLTVYVVIYNSAYPLLFDFNPRFWHSLCTYALSTEVNDEGNSKTGMERKNDAVNIALNL